MKKLNMRILAALLALLMFVNSCPTFAVATDPEGSNIPETTQATETPATETPATEAPATEPPATDAAAATQQNPCGTCGKEDCDGNHTNWCAICKKDACGVTHVLCQICQHYDCGVTHVLCQICQNYDCGVTHHFCDICKMYDCIVDGHGETVPSDAAEDPTDPAGADGSGETAAPADHCPWCEDTLGEDGEVIHSELCNAAYAYNGAADMGKYAKLSGDAISYGMDVSANPKTDKTGKQFFSTDFEDNTILRITGWYWDSETTALWYRVGFYSGGAVAAAGWPASAWILQKYTDPDNDYGVSLSIFSGCSICGAPECEALHVFCESCKIYDCGVDHDAKEPDSVSEDGGSDHSADIGKYLKLNSAVSSFSVYNTENGNTLTYVHDDFTGDAIMRVADWKIDAQGLWYLVEFYKGGIVESSFTVDFPANPWFLQTDGTAANAFLFMQCCATCGLPDCDGNHETETVPSVSHPSGITVSSDSGIPADSAVSMANHSSVGDGSENVYDIKVLNADGTKWQPAPGETVRVSMPVSIEHDGSVTVMHILEDAAQITYALANGKAEVQDLADVDATFQSLLGDAVAAYRAATGSSANAVAYELFEDVPVLNGYVTVDACGFSIYVLSESGYAEVDMAWDELSPFMTYYVKPGDTITFSTTSSAQNNWSFSDTNGIVTAHNRIEDNWLIPDRYYKEFNVSAAASVSQTFTITFGGKTVTFQVIPLDAPEEDINKQTVAISIYRGEGFPAEPLKHSATYWRYSTSGISTSQTTDYSDTTNGLIWVDKFEASNLKVENSNGDVAAIVDNTGKRTLEFIGLSEELKADLVAKCLAQEGKTSEDPDDYEFLIYVVKRESGYFTGTKWYINGKVVKKDKVFVTYERNLPDDYFDDFVLENQFPLNQDVDRGESVTLSSNVKTPISTTVDGKKVTATWLGWSTDPNATAPEYTGGQTINNLQTDLKLYAVWQITGVEYKVSDIEISKWVVFDTSGQPDYTDAEEYSFTLTGNGLAGAAYMIHDYSGTQVGESGTITASPFAFTLKNGHTIVISDVPQGTYSVTEAEKEGYKLATGAARTRTFTFGTGNGEINVGEYLTTYENRKIQYYTITFFDGTNMTALVDPNPRRYEENEEVPLESISKPGYHFAGWKCEDSTCSNCTGNDPQYHTGSFVMPARNIELYAQWDPHTYEVRFNGNGATSGSMAAQPFTYDVAQLLNANQFAKAYNVNFDAQGGTVAPSSAAATAEFTGWKNGAAAYSDQQSVTNLTTVDGGVYELTAQWQMGSVTLPEPTRAGYTFGGWYVDDEFAAADKAGDAGASYTPSQNVTLYAKWTPNTYTVHFDANGGTLAADATVTYTVEESVAIPVPIRNGCTFNGWIVTSTDGSAENWASSYAGNQILTDMYGNVTLTANWSATLSVSIDNGTIKAAEDPLPNGTHSVAVGSYANTDIKFTPADGYRITGVTVTVGDEHVETTFEPDGYTYRIGSDGVTEKISIVVTTSNTVTVTFKSWDGTVLDTQDVTPGGAATAPAAPARVGHSFTGWDTAFDNVTTDLVVTAQYSVNSYKVTWDFDNGDNVSNQAWTYGATITAPTGREKTGYQFDKWSPAIPEKMPASDLNFKALWTPNAYTVHFDGNGATSGSMAAQHFTYDVAQTLNANQFAKAYTVTFDAQGGTVAQNTATATATFTGWKYGDATYEDQQNVKNLTAVNDATCTLVAQWQLGSVKLPEPTRAGYTFGGWYVDADCTGSAYGGVGVACVPTQDMTLYAKWTPKSYTVDVHFNTDHVSFTGLDGFAATEGGLQKVVEYGTELNIEANLKTGYEIDQVLINDAVQENFNGTISHKVLQNTVIEVKTKPISYPITWTDDAGNTLLTQEVPYGETPVYPNGTPTKTPAENDPYTYRFAGWTPEIQTVTGEATYTATYDALFDFKVTIDHGIISYKDASVIKELERKDVVKGSDVDTQMVFKPEAGYQIKSVSVNGVPQTVTLESDGSYIHTFGNGMRAEEKLIEVVTEPIEVVINIQFTDGSNLLEIHVQKYSDVLLAITPKSGTTINAIELTGSENSETTNVTGVPNGYIYTATGIQESVTIVVNATSKDVFCAAASIDHGTVSIHCGDTTVTSKQSAAGNYINYDAVYTFTMTADGGRHITKVDNTIFGEYTTEHPIDGVMNAHKVVLAQTEETVHNITYILDNGSDDWRTTAAYGNVISLREAPVKSGYNFKGWWYDKDADSTVDGDELLAAGASFTMPNHGVTMTAQWLDSRLDSPHKVYVGINMSFYNSNGGWYYSLPQNEPAIMHGLVSVRAYKDTFETTTWYIQTENINGDKFTKNLPGAPSLYITEDVFKPEGGYVNNLTTGGAEGIFDPTGAKTRACLKLSEADYQGIIQGWLDSSISYLKNEFPNTNLDWNAISKNAEDYTIIPYVVKRQNNGNNWFIDMVIQPSARYNITYKMNLDNGYTSEVEEFTDNTGYGQGFQAKLANPKQATNTNRPNAEPRFLGWWYDKNDNQIVETAELYGAGELFTMPAKNVELVAQWEYPKRLKIVETTGKSSDTFFFDVVGTNGGKTVLSMTVSVQGGGYVIIDDIFTADYTATEKNQWSWTYETGTNAITKSVAADATADTVFEFSKAKKNVCWLFDENHN